MPENVVRVAMRFTRSTFYSEPDDPPTIDDMVCTFHVQAEPSHDPPDVGNLEDIAEIFYSWWHDDGPDSSALRNRYFAAHHLADITTKVVQPTESDDFVRVVDEPGQVTAVDLTYLPPQVAMLVSLYTAVAERTHRGRVYLPPFDGQGGSYEYDGQLNGDLLDAVALLFGHLVSLIGAYESPGAFWSLAVYSRKLGTAQAVQQFRLADRWCTQRRRARMPITHYVYGLDGLP